MTARDPDISVVIPLYNEEENVLPLLNELVPCLQELARGFEIVAVDDGSEDSTSKELLEAQDRFAVLRHLRLARNSGQTAALAAGFQAARGSLVVTMDGDLQVDPSDIGPMISTLENTGVDLVYGWRQERNDEFLRRISAKIANWIRNHLTGESIKDTGCPLKVFRREVLQALPRFNGMHRFLITLAHIEGFRSVEMEVRHRKRRAGASKYGIWNRVFRALRDCLAVRWMQKRHLSIQAEEVREWTS